MTDTHSVIEDVWERHQDENWRRDQSHWRGHGRWKDDDKWQAIGSGSLSKLRAAWRLLGRPHFPEPLVALEWGPGGGSNLFAFRRFCHSYFGVDISAANLAECQRMITEEGYNEVFKPVLLTDEPNSIVNHIDEPIDLFLSTAVFQHFPSKEYGENVLRAVRKVCKPDAIGIIQIRYDNGNEKFSPIADLSEYKERHITANSYQIDEFWKILRETGFSPLMIRDINAQINYATFFFRVA